MLIPSWAAAVFLTVLFSVCGALIMILLGIGSRLTSLEATMHEKVRHHDAEIERLRQRGHAHASTITELSVNMTTMRERFAEHVLANRREQP